MELPIVYLKNTRNSLHPHIFSKMVNHPKNLQTGSCVEVRSRENSFIGIGFYNPTQTVAIRLITERKDEPFNKDFFYNRFQTAKILREDILKINETSNSYRIINAEADGFPGLIVDKFSNVIIIEPYTAGYKIVIDWIVESLARLYPECQISLRVDQRTENRERISFEYEMKKYPHPDKVDVLENGMKMRVDLVSGHKTGFFLDQRENRLKIRALAQNKNVLDLCCYTGGFAISAALGNAKHVVGVDLDEKAIHIAKANADKNNVKIRFQHSDAFDVLRNIIKSHDTEKPDLIILDPAKLANVKDEIPRAMKMYGDLNKLAMQACRNGGLLMTCSCSGLIPEETFLSILTRSAAEANVIFQIISITGAANDHPIALHFPEGRYLKAVLGRMIRR